MEMFNGPGSITCKALFPLSYRFRSDAGIGSSFSTEDGEEVSPFEIIQMFMDFKSTKGKFVERRVNSVLKKLKKQKWSHYDDISMSAIHIEGSNETENKKQW